jgi:GT2 family glycosyltransferase
MASLISLRKPEGTEIAIASCSLVYESRHTLAQKAINEGFDRVLWLDSDMTFGPDLLERFSADLDNGKEFVCGLFFTRKNPIMPCVYEVCRPRTKRTGEVVPAKESFREIPDGIFEIEGCGFAAVMMTTDLIRSAGPLPFYPEEGFGEDLTFCRKVRAAGKKLYCDPGIKVGHIGIQVIDENTWKEAGGR